MMKRNILFTIAFAGGIMLANAGERFQDQTEGDTPWKEWMWFEITGEGTCQTASAENIDIEFVLNDSWEGGQHVVEPQPRLKGTKDSTQPNWVQGIAGPNFNGNLGTIVVPEFVQHNGAVYTVTAIGDFSFASDYGKLYPSTNTFILPKSVTSIGKGAFFGYTNLKNLDLGSTEVIGDYAFAFCSGLEGSYTFPSTLREIGDGAFYGSKSLHELIFTSRVEKIGKDAFYRTGYNVHNFYLPASVTEIGSNAFNFVTNGSNFTDLYYPNANPGDIDPNAFGLVDNYDEFTWNEDYFAYATVCLHVPMGTREIYKSKEGWKYFKCIIDDLIPENGENSHSDSTDPMSYVLDYVYMVPGETLNLKEDVLGDTKGDYVWVPVTVGHRDYDVLELDSEGKVVAKNFGSHIAIATRENTTLDPNGGESKPFYNVSGAVVIFVCPTITVVNDKNSDTDRMNRAATRNLMITRSASGEDDSNGENYAHDVDEAISNHSSYSHRVIINSFPKLQIDAVPSIEIQTIERAKVDADNNYTEDGAQFHPLDDTQFTDDGRVVPLNPVSENRVVLVDLHMDENVWTSLDKVEVGGNITVSTSSRTLVIHGAADNSLVYISTLDGRTAYKGFAKTVELEPGVYVVSVEDAAFKAIVR